MIPYGGGTNVTDALRCPPDERRTIVSLDLRRMNRVLWIDPVNHTARDRGRRHRHARSRSSSRRHGFTLGHEPDSAELSTLGGWIATNASGMKKNRYGNIEDLVLAISAVTPQGDLARAALPRESVGADPARWLIGSEGELGIVTSAVTKVFPLPAVRRFGSVLFESFEEGFALPLRGAALGRGAGQRAPDGQPPVPVRPGAQAREEPARRLRRARSRSSTCCA